MILAGSNFPAMVLVLLSSTSCTFTEETSSAAAVGISTLLSSTLVLGQPVQVLGKTIPLLRLHMIMHVNEIQP